MTERAGSRHGGMSVKRGFIAASIFLGYKLLLFFLCLGLMAGSGSGGVE